jgi:hypothetical protein
VLGFAAPANAATTAATLTIAAYGPGGTGGHAFLVVTNGTASTEAVGTYSLPAHGGMTVGTWGNKPDGKGVYYDLEAYYSAQTVGGAAKLMPGHVSLTMNLTATQNTPTNLAGSIKKKSGYKTNIGLPSASASQVRRMNGTGTKAVTSGSLKKSSGSS